MLKDIHLKKDSDLVLTTGPLHPNMKETFGTPAGLSDHTLGISLPIAAVSLGSKIIGKHFILDRNLGGSDAAFSMEPDEFKAMVKSVRELEKALGEVSYDLTEKMKKSREFSRSLFVVKDMCKWQGLFLWSWK